MIAIQFSCTVDLMAGDTLLSHSGRQIVVQDIRVSEAETMVYNMTVESPHNYAVGVPGVLVHNK